MIKSFQDWLESLQLHQVIAPRDYTKRIYVSDDKNPEQIAAWQKQNTHKVFKFPLSKEKFIHFTPRENIPEILKTGLLKGSSVFAVSTSFGKWFPRVQFTHIKHDKNNKRSDQIDAIVFKTNKIPAGAHGEEVIWHDSVPILNAQVISTRSAINILKHTPYGKEIEENDQNRVEYID